MDSNDEKEKNSELGSALASNGDQRDAKSWFNFGNRPTTQRSDYGVLNIHEDSIDYDMKHKKFGKCLILNHEFFEDNKCLQRKGSTADASALFRCFGSIGFDVIMKNDLKRDQLIEYVSKLAKEDHSDNDCFVCCILTHGQTDSLWANDYTYCLDIILSFFTGDNCKSLAGKPKIFIIQACRGVEFDDGVHLKVATDVTDSGNSKLVKIPVYADFLIAFSTMSGFYSWRNQAEGSWFVKHLTDIIHKYHKSYDMLSMLTIVNQKIAYNNASKTENKEFNDKKQVACITHTLTRRIFLMPKDNNSIQSSYL